MPRMTLMDAVRAATGRTRAAKAEGEKPEDEDMEDDETTSSAEGEEDETVAEGEEDETAAEGEEDETAAEGEEDETAAEGEETEPDAEGEEDGSDAEGEEGDDKNMSAADRAVFARGRAAERKRIGAILSSPHAEANPKLAAHLAFRSSDAASKALATLKAGGASATAGLGGRMANRPSQTGRGGERVSANAVDGGWGKAMKTAGVAVRDRK